jgi:hypothetical protein
MMFLPSHTQGAVDVAVQLFAATWATVSPPAGMAAVLGIPFKAGISTKAMPLPAVLDGSPGPPDTQRLPLGSTNTPSDLYSPRPVMSIIGVVVVTAGAAYGISYSSVGPPEMLSSW